MPTTTYTGKGNSVDQAREELYKHGEPSGHIMYAVSVAGKPIGKKHKRYETAFASGLEAAGIDKYVPTEHSLEVEAEAKFKVPARASGSSEKRRTTDTLTDLF
jgi:hypothetical protein